MVAASVIFLCSFIGFLEAGHCPSMEDMLPCKCYSNHPSKNDIKCTNIFRPEELIPPMRALERSKTEVFELEIRNSSLLHFPENLFKNTHIEWIRFHETKINGLDFNFNGLEKLLNRIHAEDVEFVSRFHFDQLRNLKKLNYIIFERCSMDATVNELPYLPKLWWLFVIRSDISRISDKAFANLPDLTVLYLQNNKITEMKRSMFSNPANSLEKVYLSNNMLSYLPDDFFQNMPNLREVDLWQNKFVTISEKPFLELLRNHGLEVFYIGELLHCDCKLSWLGSIRLPARFTATCKTPTALSGRSINRLDFKSLQCEE